MHSVDENKCGSWLAGFVRSQLVRIYTVFKRGYRILKKIIQTSYFQWMQWCNFIADMDYVNEKCRFWLASSGSTCVFKRWYMYRIWKWYVQMVDKSICHFMLSPFKTVYFQNFCKNYCCKTIEATIMKKVQNESKLIYVINILTSLVFLYQPF